jgi:hypothetical protein
VFFPIEHETRRIDILRPRAEDASSFREAVRA